MLMPSIDDKMQLSWLPLHTRTRAHNAAASTSHQRCCGGASFPALLPSPFDDVVLANTNTLPQYAPL
jgi:hypothetical protein